MFERRNGGCIVADFKAGDSLTDRIYDEISKQQVGWNARELNSLELFADTDFTFSIDGWDWSTINGHLFISNMHIRNLTINQDVTGLRAMFRYDD